MRLGNPAIEIGVEQHLFGERADAVRVTLAHDLKMGNGGDWRTLPGDDPYRHGIVRLNETIPDVDGFLALFEYHQSIPPPPKRLCL